MEELNDVELVKKCLAGNVNAFEPLVERYQKPIFNVALKMLNDYENARDISQTVFVKAFEKLDSFNPKYKFFSWIYRMAVNESINFMKRKRPSEELDMRMKSEERHPEQQVLHTELREKVENALMKLRLEYRAIIVLRHFEELSYNEIGYVMNIPEKTVKSRLFSARQQLRTILIKKEKL